MLNVAAQVPGREIAIAETIEAQAQAANNRLEGILDQSQRIKVRLFGSEPVAARDGAKIPPTGMAGFIPRLQVQHKEQDHWLDQVAAVLDDIERRLGQ